MNKFTVCISPKAVEMLELNLAFLTKKSKPAAINHRNKIFKAFSDLETLPLKFEIIATIAGRNYHKMVVLRRYIVVYYIENQTVVVDKILDGRSNNSKWFL